MKKCIFFILSFCLCSLVNIYATEMDYCDFGESTIVSSDITLSQVSDLGPTVAKGIKAYCYDRGNVPGYIKIDVYYASNACNAYVAYMAGETTGAMVIRKNTNKRYIAGYYIVYDGIKYYFDI